MIEDEFPSPRRRRRGGRHGLDSARSERLVSDDALDQRLEDRRRRQAAIKVQSLVRGRATRKKQRMASQP